MKREILSAAVVCTLAGLAAAQDTLPFGGEVIISPSQVIAANPPLQEGYQSRAASTVYDNQSNLNANGSLALLAMVRQALEDVNFEPGPWGANYQGSRVIDSVSFGVTVTNTVTTPNEAILIQIWNPADINFNGFDGPGTSMIRTGAAPVGTVSASVGINYPGFVYRFTLPSLNIALPEGLTHVVVQAGWLSAQCLVSDRSIVFGSNSLAGPGGNPATIGSTLTDNGRDSLSSACCDNIGTFLGYPLGNPATCNEHRGVVGTTTQLGLDLKIGGNVQPPSACNPDVNQDGATDQGDVDYLINALAGGSNPNNIDTDFNQDGASDQGDIDALVNVVAGGPCP